MSCTHADKSDNWFVHQFTLPTAVSQLKPYTCSYIYATTHITFIILLNRTNSFSFDDDGDGYDLIIGLDSRKHIVEFLNVFKLQKKVPV